MECEEPRRRKVVFYGRVSTEIEAQISALKNQMEWYRDLAAYHPDWVVVGQYVDEGISGTNIKNRPSFMKMLRDARKGKFDLIVTREVSRFARNTVDTLVTTRELKQYGVEVYFVYEDIWTMGSDGEVRLTIMASLAQDESRKISERVKAGIKTKKGKGEYCGMYPYGYEYDKNTRNLVPSEKKAAIVRKIFALYSEGLGGTAIAGILAQEQVPSPSGNAVWKETAILHIIKNEVYKGVLVYNKNPVKNYLDHKSSKNDESEYLYTKGKFEPLVPEELWDKCNRLLSAKKSYQDGNVTQAYKCGKSAHPDKWACRLFCGCGARVVPLKCNPNISYTCYRNYRRNPPLDKETQEKTRCSIPNALEWKLELMAKELYHRLWEEHRAEILEVYRTNCDAESSQLNSSVANDEQKEESVDYQERLQELEMLYRQELVSASAYARLHKEYEQRISNIRERNGSQSDEVAFNMEKIEESLAWKENFPDGKISREFLDAFVTRIVNVDGQHFIWELDLAQEHYIAHGDVLGSYRFPSVSVSNIVKEHKRNKKQPVKRKGGAATKLQNGSLSTEKWAHSKLLSNVDRLLLKNRERKIVA